LVSKKEKKYKKLHELSYEYDNVIAYDITKYFKNKLSLKINNKIDFECKFYQNDIFNSKQYADEKLKQNKIYSQMQSQVKSYLLKRPIFLLY